MNFTEKMSDAPSWRIVEMLAQSAPQIVAHANVQANVGVTGLAEESVNTRNFIHRVQCGVVKSECIAGEWHWQTPSVKRLMDRPLAQNWQGSLPPGRSMLC